MDKTTKTVVWVVIVLVLVGLIYTMAKKSGHKQASNSNGQMAAGETIKIGFIGPLTGDASSIGTVNRAGVELAAEDINKAGGKKVEIVYEDGACNAKTATNAANKLINSDHVVAIVGGLCSTETAAFGPAAISSKVIVMSYGSSAPNLSRLGKYFFRDYPSDAYQGKFGAEYAYNTLGARKVAVLYHISDYGTGIKDVFVQHFQELGGTIVSEEGTPQDAKDYRTQLSKLKNLQPDLYYMPTYPAGATVAIQQARELGIKETLFAGDSWDDTKLQKDVSGKGNMLYTAAQSLYTDEFKTRVLAKTGGQQVPIGTPQAYDALKLLVQVIGQVGTDPDKIQGALHQVQYQGISGSISFDEHGDLTVARYDVKKFENGGAMMVK